MGREEKEREEQERREEREKSTPPPAATVLTPRRQGRLCLAPTEALHLARAAGRALPKPSLVSFTAILWPSVLRLPRRLGFHSERPTLHLGIKAVVPGLKGLDRSCSYGTC